MSTIIITGSRQISGESRYAVRTIVVPWLVEQGVTRVVHGGARGFDEFVAALANLNGIETACVPAEWERHGPAAGPIRNERMIREWAAKSAFLLEFPGSRGTSDCVKRATAYGLPVVRVVPGRGVVALAIQDTERAIGLIRAKQQEVTP